ncbi:MAG: D-alanyl-D-alanine carboxypeptidase family protein, partial [Selenomonadaceae bacterium]|nr:D-alanyl-D-alanine carboxypeptidase family protein [Selenomonadaceae bacterium]
FNGKTYTLECPVPDEQIYDALAVVGVAIAAGYSLDKTLEHLKTFTTIKGRGNLVGVEFNGKALRLIDSTYNANPTSMTKALEYLKTLETDGARRVAVLGDIAELGKDEIDQHRRLAGAVLNAQPDRVLLVGSLMKHLWDDIKDKVKGAWFPSYKELIGGIDGWLHDGDTVLLKSSHSTNVEAVIKHLASQKAEPITQSIAPSAPQSSSGNEPLLNVPPALFDVKNFLPKGITPALNGHMPPERMGKTACGGLLYVNAARSLEAMVDAAERDGVFININRAFKCYRPFQVQELVFKKRFTPLDSGVPVRAEAARVEFEGKIWQLNEGEVFAQVPGQSSHGYGLAVDIQNEGVRSTRQWLNANAERFGFVREFDFESWHFTYVRGRQDVADCVLEYEAQAPRRTWTADQIVEASGCQWYGDAPTADWTCRGLLSVRPLKIKMLTVFDPLNVIGFDKNLLDKIFRQCAGFVCTSPDELMEFKKPLLVTNDLAGTVQRLNALFNGD